MRVSANPARGKFGILTRSEGVLSLCFWTLALLVFGTYLIDDSVDSSITLFPLARGFRIKPAVFVFAPAWFLCCMLLAYSVFLKVQECSALGMSSFHILLIKIVGLTMVVAAMMSLFMTIPLWVQADYVTVALVACFPLWFVVTQGFTPRSLIYSAVYIVLTVLSAVKDVAVYMNVICSVILLIQLILYPCCFPKPPIKLYWHFEVLSQRRVKDTTEADKQYEMVEMDSKPASDGAKTASEAPAVEEKKE